MKRTTTLCTALLVVAFLLGGCAAGQDAGNSVCAEEGCGRERLEGSSYCAMHAPESSSDEAAASDGEPVQSTETQEDAADVSESDADEEQAAEAEQSVQSEGTQENETGKTGSGGSFVVPKDSTVSAADSSRSSVTGNSNGAEKEKQHSYDPYGVYDYDDPDEFAEEWAEEFGDGSFDEGYDDAYDYWEDENGE